MDYLYSGTTYYLVFPDGIKIQVEKELWNRLLKLKEQDSL